MSEQPPNPVNQPLTPEHIEVQTNYRISAVYPGFAEEGYVTPSVHEDRERLAYDTGKIMF